MKLSVQNYVVYEKRIESLRKEELRQQTQVTARAVAELSVLWSWAVEYLAPGGVLLSIKGGEASKEIKSVSRLETVGDISITAFPGWLNIDKSRFVISVKKKVGV
jgi:16S rRNA G527 N7-methylase RsmG